jgi:hypothetical protein
MVEYRSVSAEAVEKQLSKILSLLFASKVFCCLRNHPQSGETHIIHKSPAECCLKRDLWIIAVARLLEQWLLSGYPILKREDVNNNIFSSPLPSGITPDTDTKGTIKEANI